MLMLAGLMGLMAVGAVAFMGAPEADDMETEEVAAEEGPNETGTDMGEAGHDLLEDDAAGVAVSGVPQTVEIRVGDEGADRLIGDGGADRINGYGGDDLIAGRGGDDGLHGGQGDDRILGGPGDDALHGEDGEDILRGQAGDDEIFGHNGDDRLVGGAGDDSVQGAEGNDRLFGNAGEDLAHGGLGDDVVIGGGGQDTLFGGWGDDVVIGAGDGAADFLNGGGGADLIAAGPGDIVTGGEDADRLILFPEPGGAPVQVMDFEAGQDRLVVAWDFDSHPDPEPRLEADPHRDDVSHLLIGENEIAVLHGPVDLADLLLVDKGGLSAGALARG